MKNLPPEEEVFETPPAPKPKRKLTEKQRAALEKGRAKMAEKRRLKLEKEGIKEHVDLRKEQNQQKKERKKEMAVLEKVKVRERHRKEEEHKTKKLSEWEEKRLNFLDKCQNENQFNLMKEILDSIEDNDVMDDETLNKKILEKKEEIVKKYTPGEEESKAQ